MLICRSLDAVEDMSNFVVQNGYNLEALGAPNHLGVASDPYSNGHYPAGQTGRIHEITYPGQVGYLPFFLRRGNANS